MSALWRPFWDSLASSAVDFSFWDVVWFAFVFVFGLWVLVFVGLDVGLVSSLSQSWVTGSSLSLCPVHASASECVKRVFLALSSMAGDGLL